MSILGFGLETPFRLRSSRRDRDTDVARAAKLGAFLNDLRAEIEQESDGLSSRFERTQANAAFSLQAIENGESGSASPAIDQLTEKVLRYSARLAVLRAQVEFLIELGRDAERFPLNAENEELSEAS